jgi:YD repeat-containing protein
MFSGSTGYLTGIERNGQTLTVYTQYGIPIGLTTSNGKTLWFTMDGNYRITQVALPDGRHVSYSYDTAGNLATVTDLRGGVTSYTYDSGHRLLTDVDPNGHTVATNTYGSDGSIATQTDALGNTTTTRYLPPGYTPDLAPTGPQQVRVATPISYSRISFRTSATGTGANSITVTLRLNGVATALTISFLPTVQTSSATAATVSAVEGDYFDMQVTKAGVITGSPADLYVTLGEA